MRESHRYKREMELSQTTEEIQHSDKSAFTSIRPQGECNLRVLFEQSTQSQETKSIGF